MYQTQALHRAVQQHPDRVAARYGNRATTFLQFEYLMAVPWGGGSVNPCNIRWSPAEIAYSLKDSETGILLVDETFRPIVEQIRRQSTVLREVIYCGDGDVPEGMHGYEALISGSDAVPDAVRRGEDLAGIFYTGGTTGYPKGVMLSHTNLCSAALALATYGVPGPNAVLLHAAPMFHLADLLQVNGAWIQASTHVIVPGFTPDLVLDAIERERVTYTLLVPTMIRMLLDYLDEHGPRDLSSLRGIIYGASPMPEALLDRLMAVLPEIALTQAYGMTELSPLATINLPESYTPEGRKLGRHHSVGQAAVCSEVRIVDPVGNDVPTGTVGEVIVRGPNVMQAYWKQPNQTSIALRDGWMHTGDGGYMDEHGYFYIVDRLKDMIITGGENVYSAEVENVLSRHPAVSMCAVIGVPSAEWGESVHAVVVLARNELATAEELIAFCQESIARYKCPATVAFVDALPISGAGKILKAELRKPFWVDRSKSVS